MPHYIIIGEGIDPVWSKYACGFVIVVREQDVTCVPCATGRPSPSRVVGVSHHSSTRFQWVCQSDRRSDHQSPCGKETPREHPPAHSYANASTGCFHAGEGAGPACMDDVVVGPR